MKRSEINQYIKQAIEFFDKNNFKLPVWATATPEEWEKMAATGNYTPESCPHTHVHTCRP